jgi:4-hydroxy-tetrahydrodipicolinate synthase
MNSCAEGGRIGKLLGESPVNRQESGIAGAIRTHPAVKPHPCRGILSFALDGTVNPAKLDFVYNIKHLRGEERMTRIRNIGGGVFPAATTQFHADQSLDLSGTIHHWETLIGAGIHGLLVLGSIGENCSLEDDEKLRVVRAAVEHVAGRIPVLAGVAECSTARACRFAADAQKAGADGLMVLPALAYRADPRETMAHLRAVAAASSLPIMVYNNPSSYVVDITPKMFADLADEPKFVAIKESSGDVRRLTDLKNLCGDRYTLFCGIDDLILESVLLGAEGWVSGLVNAFPEENRLLWDLATAGRYAEALQVYRWYTPLLHLDTHPKLVQYIKLAAAECGHGKETVRMPRLPLTGSEREQVLVLVRHAIRTRPCRAGVPDAVAKGRTKAAAS